MIYRFILLILLLLPLIQIWWACRVHAVGLQSLELPPSSNLTFKTVPCVINLLGTKSVTELDCVERLCASTWQKPQTQVTFSGGYLITTLHLCFYTEVASRWHSLSNLVFFKNTIKGFCTSHFGMWLMVLPCLCEQLYNGSRSGSSAIEHWKTLYYNSSWYIISIICDSYI